LDISSNQHGGVATSSDQEVIDVKMFACHPGVRDGDSMMPMGQTTRAE
jgi:hypothetical protein